MSKKILIFIFLSFFIFITFLSSQTIKATMAGQPDLAISNFWNWPKTPTSREWFDIKVRVYNLSDTALTRQTALHIFVGGSNRPYILPISSFAAKKSRDFIQRVFLDAPGKYVARAIVDPENRIQEIREDNNTKRMEFRVRQAASNEYLPDLSIYTPNYMPEKPCTDDHIEFKATITNIGAVRSPRSKAAIKIGGGTPHLIDVPQILPGEYKKISFSRVLPIARTYKVTVYADYNNKIKEYDEGNNEKSNSFVVYDNCCPDYTISNNYVWIWPKNPKAGEKFDLRVRIFNVGHKKPLNHTTLKIYVGGSITPHVLNVSPISAHSERTIDQELSFSRPGKYRVRVYVDRENKVRECREDNNKGHVVFRVK